MNQTLPPSILIKTWVDIARNTEYPEAQEIASQNLYMFFNDISQAELYLEIEKIKISIEPDINGGNQLVIQQMSSV